MKIELNRRTFLAVLGAATVASVAQRKKTAPVTAAANAPNGVYFFSNSGNVPAGRPRTAAITYLPLNDTVEPEFQG